MDDEKPGDVTIDLFAALDMETEAVAERFEELENNQILGLLSGFLSVDDWYVYCHLCLGFSTVSYYLLFSHGSCLFFCWSLNYGLSLIYCFNDSIILAKEQNLPL